MTIRIDTSELRRLAADLGRFPTRLRADVYRAGDEGARLIAEDAKRRISGHPHAPAYPSSITWERRAGELGQLGWEIGPDKARRQGALGNILEFGTSKNAPIPHLAPAGEAQAARIGELLADAVAGRLGGL